MTEMAINVRGLVKRFNNKAAVDGVDIQMPRGKVWGFLGPNGSGKTTTIRMICGLLEPSEGQGQCLGFDILSQSSEIKRRTGYMTQKFSFWEDLTIRENLDFVARLYQLPERRKVVDETLENLGLSRRQKQLAGALSGGWKQRLALAAVTMSTPDLLLLDEPTAGVDPQARRDFWDEIHRLSLNGMTVLVSTHYMDEAERCDHIVYLANGKLLTQGSVRDIIQHSGLHTFEVSGEHVREIASALNQEADVDNSAYFSGVLRVSGRDKQALSNAIERHISADMAYQPIEPNLEDAFIALMTEAGEDNREHL